MLFSSVPFLYYFLPIVLFLYFIVPKSLKNVVLLLSSLFFYGWGEPKYVFLMIGTIAVGYVSGILIEKYRKSFASELVLATATMLFLGALGYFKYADFFIENLNRLTLFSRPLLKIALPIGISFYTFQILSYVIDVFRGDVKAQRNPVILGTYVALFPQLIAGPIVRYSDVEKQLTSRTHSFEKAYTGIQRFVTGFAKKIILANTLGELCEIFNASNEKSVLFYWLFAFSYMLQIYFDFSGYFDMAIGLGKILGFDFSENFNYPFISKSITEFWRRWHISLGTWFRDYVYIPLGGNRVKKSRHLFNIFFVWLLTGFWHGAEWNFIVWGLYFGVLLTIEKFFLLKKTKNSKILSHIYVLILTAISFVIFSANNMTEALRSVGGLFGYKGLPLVSKETLYYLKSFGFVIVISAICSTPLLKSLKNRLSEKKIFSKVLNVLEIPVMILIMLICTAYLADGSFNPFLYFRF